MKGGLSEVEPLAAEELLREFAVPREVRSFELLVASAQPHTMPSLSTDFVWTAVL